MATETVEINGEQYVAAKWTLRDILAMAFGHYGMLTVGHAYTALRWATRGRVTLLASHPGRAWNLFLNLCSMGYLWTDWRRGDMPQKWVRSDGDWRWG